MEEDYQETQKKNLFRNGKKMFYYSITILRFPIVHLNIQVDNTKKKIDNMNHINIKKIYITRVFLIYIYI